MKKLLTAVLSAAAISAPFVASADTASQTTQNMTQPEKAKGVWIDVRSAEEFNAGHLQDAVNIKSLHAFKRLAQIKMHPLISIAAVVAVQKPH